LRATITFAGRDNKTTLTLRARFENAARQDAALRAGYSVSWGEAFGLLAQHINWFHSARGETS
jgi:hypothetical protein